MWWQFFFLTYRVFKVKCNKKNLCHRHTNHLDVLKWFFSEVLCLTFFLSKFHWFGSNRLSATSIWSIWCIHNRNSKIDRFSRQFSFKLLSFLNGLSYRCPLVCMNGSWIPSVLLLLQRPPISLPPLSSPTPSTKHYDFFPDGESRPYW